MTPRWLALLASVLIALPASAQTTWYVDVNGTPPGTGTAANPFTSIQQALDHPAVAGGHTVLVAPGVYPEVLNFQKALTLRSQAGPAVTWIEPNDPAAHVGFVVNMSGTSQGVLAGFTVSGAKVASSSGAIADNSTVRDCILTGHKQNPANPQFTGDALVSGFDFWVEGCTVSGNAKGFRLIHVAAVYSRNSIFQGNSVWDLDPVALSSVSTFDYTLVGASAPPGSGNLSGDPRFWYPAERDFHLGPLSPCIDAGDPSAPPDPDGSPRDIGALAYDAAYAPGPVVFCTAKTNSQGCIPQIGSSGHATATGSAPFVVTASRVVPGKGGLLFYGPGKRAQPLPFQAGWHCVQLPTKRVGIQKAGGTTPCTGTYTFDFGAYLGAGSHPLLFPGALIACQWWSRDPLEPTGWGTGLTDALFFGVAP